MPPYRPQLEHHYRPLPRTNHAGHGGSGLQRGSGVPPSSSLPSAPVRGARPPERWQASDDPFAATLNKLRTEFRILQQRRTAERSRQHHCKLSGDQGNEEGQTLTVEDCTICYEPLQAPDACTTACGHVFHSNCLAKCFAMGRQSQRHIECPICRTHVHRAELITLHNGLPSRSTEAPPSPDILDVDDLEDNSSEAALGREIDHALLNCITSIESKLSAAISSYAHKKTLLDAEYHELKTQVDDKRRRSEVDLQRKTEELRKDRRDVDKVRAEARSIKSELAAEKKELSDKFVEVNRKLTELAAQQNELELKGRELANKQAEANDLEHALKKREVEITKIAHDLKRKRAKLEKDEQQQNRQYSTSSASTANTTGGATQSNSIGEIRFDDEDVDKNSMIDLEDEDEDEDLVEKAARDARKKKIVNQSQIRKTSFIPTRSPFNTASLHKPPNRNRPPPPKSLAMNRTASIAKLGAGASKSVGLAAFSSSRRPKQQQLRGIGKPQPQARR